MNSYPIELLAQPCPVMFVAGLDAPQTSVSTPTPPAPAATAPSNGSSHQRTHSVQTSGTQDPFTLLHQRLRDALTQVPKNAVWLADRGKSFQVHIVEKNVRFPPRKIFPPTPANRLEETLSASTIARSPLSPLMPSSPLHPDGLIAPIWMRKHLELVPAVFVLFLRLWEPPAPISPLEPNEAHDEERRHDMDLATEIAARKKSASERGIKLTVVLITSRRMLDDPNLDPRLTFIRRQSALDSRAALFVLSPVTAAELADFVRSLQDALYDSAMEYYSSHSKRVRRKRNRHAAPASTAPVPPVLSANPKPMPLRPAGWTIRYEYKLATFAEFRSEEEVARKHYEECWIQLVDMFSSTGGLPPRTKRWAEAKVLVDCISIKICKLYLYHGEHARALAHINRHVQRFSELSRAWGIGEDTFEFWSWLARQQRCLGELLEHGLRTGLRIPVHIPQEPPNAALAAQLATASGSVRGSVDINSVAGATLAGIAPANALQHPGFYYFAAAQHTQKRFAQFLQALEIEATQPSALSATPGFANEKKVDHQALVLELYTRAYDLFKKFNPTASRLTLYIAYHIALAYHSAGKFDLAVRFFERIAKTYRREQWGKLLYPILTTWYASVRQLQDIRTAVRLLVEMLANGITPNLNDGENAADELVDLLKVFCHSYSTRYDLTLLRASTPEKDETVRLEITGARPLGDWISVFWNDGVFVNDPAPFQLHLQARAGVPFSGLPVSKLLLFFGTQNPTIIIEHKPGQQPPSNDSVVQVVVGQFSIEDASRSPLTVQADLRAPTAPGRLVICGAVSRATPGDIEVSQAILCLQQGSWNIEIPINVGHSDLAAASTSLVWLSSIGPPAAFVAVHRHGYSVTSVRHPPHDLQVLLNHHSPAYLDEAYPIHIDVTNNDRRTLSLTVDVLLQPMEHGAEDIIYIDEQKSGTLLKSIPCGVLRPHETLRKTLTLSSTRSGGDRVLDISIQSRAIADTGEDAATDNEEINALDAAHTYTNEVLHTLTVPTAAPFEHTWGITYSCPEEPMQGPSDMSAYEPDAFETNIMAQMMFTCAVPGPWDIEVLGMQLEHSNFGSRRAKTCSSELDEFPLVLQAGDSYNVAISMAISRLLQGDADPPLGALRMWWKRVNNETTSTASASFFPLPVLNPPDDDVVAFVNPPVTARLHNPFSLRLLIQNRHPTRTADLSVQLETSDHFVVSGLRSGRVPLLIAGAQEELIFNMIPLSCGELRLPVMKLLDKRSGAPIIADAYSDGRPASPAPSTTTEAELVQVPIRDARFDAQYESGEDIYGPLERMTILVIP